MVEKAPVFTRLSSVDAEILEADDEDDDRELQVTDSAEAGWSRATRNRRRNNRQKRRKEKY